jgi:hypothetical protein
MTKIDFEKLFKLRLTVARFGEMDCARWWNTQGILGRYGALALNRGFPKTHRFVQAKIAFSVATHRCNEVYSHPNAYTLWNLPPDVEDRFQDKWHEWLGNSTQWTSFFQKLEDISCISLFDLILKLEFMTAGQADKAKKLSRSAESRAVKIPGHGIIDDDAIELLGAGFYLGKTGKPVVPYLPYATVRQG